MKFNFDNENDRQSVVNALHVAKSTYHRIANKSAADATDAPHFSEQFKRQAAEAQRLADQIEQDGE